MLNSAASEVDDPSLSLNEAPLSIILRQRIQRLRLKLGRLAAETTLTARSDNSCPRMLCESARILTRNGSSHCEFESQCECDC